MAQVTIGGLKASAPQVADHRLAIRDLVTALGLTNPRIREDGTVVVHSVEKGYRATARLSAMASELVGRDVHVITDDVPGASGATEL